MNIVRRYGKPDLFTTFLLIPFGLKYRELLGDILKKYFLGRPLGHVNTIEFQKRGLPHGHTLLILADECKPHDHSE